jgi:hypothetical protein
MIDIQNDEGLEILKERLSDKSNLGAVSLLKEASIDADFDDIVSEAFADKENRKFPIYSPEMAITSALYMQTQDVEPLVKEACQKALEEWGVSEVSTEMLSKEADDNSIPDDLFLLPASKKLPVIDEETLEKSASALSSNLSNLSIPERIEASMNLYKIATEQYGISRDGINSDLLMYAQETPCDLNKLAMSVTERYAETHKPEYKNMIQKIASLKNEIGGSVSFDKSVNAGITYELISLDKTAGVLDIFDATLDVYNAPYIEPETSEGLEKSASEDSVVIGRHSVLENELYKIAEEDIDSAFPGLSNILFENGVMSVEKVENFVNEMPASAVDELGSFLAGK